MEEGGWSSRQSVCFPSLGVGNNLGHKSQCPYRVEKALAAPQGRGRGSCSRSSDLRM